MDEGPRTVALALVLALAGVAAFLLLAPSRPDPSTLLDQMWSFDTLVHAAIFAAFGLLLPFAFPRVPRLLLWEALLLAAGLAELVQYLVPARDPSWADLAGNALGTLTALLPLPRRAHPAADR